MNELNAELHQNLTETGAAFRIKEAPSPTESKVRGWLTIEATQAVWRPKKGSEDGAARVSLARLIEFFEERPGQWGFPSSERENSGTMRS